MFLKIRKRFQKKSSPQDAKQGSIFRGTKASSDVPQVETGALTWASTNDEDEEEYVPSNNTVVLATTSPANNVENKLTYTFTPEELMTNELNQMRRIAEKQAEISKLQALRDELESRLEAKEKELAETKEALDMKEQELEVTHEALMDKDLELTETKQELAETKSKLNLVSKTLMELQYQWNEKTTRMWPW